MTKFVIVITSFRHYDFLAKTLSKIGRALYVVACVAEGTKLVKYVCETAPKSFFLVPHPYQDISTSSDNNNNNNNFYLNMVKIKANTACMGPPSVPFPRTKP